MSTKHNSFFKELGQQAATNYDPAVYQCIGSNLINNSFDTLYDFSQRYPQHKFVFVDKNAVYSIDSKNIEKFFQPLDSGTQKKINNKRVIGFHWFAGHPKSQDFENVLGPDNLAQHNNILTAAIRKLPNET
jgi:hypothetical protein